MDVRNFDHSLLGNYPSQQVSLIPQQLLPTGSRKDCIRLRGLPYEAQVEQILEFLGENSKNIVFQGVHMVYNAQVSSMTLLWISSYQLQFLQFTNCRLYCITGPTFRRSVHSDGQRAVGGTRGHPPPPQVHDLHQPAKPGEEAALHRGLPVLHR